MSNTKFTSYEISDYVLLWCKSRRFKQAWYVYCRCGT